MWHNVQRLTKETKKMTKVYSPRNTVKKQWEEMLASGKMPIIEQETTKGLLTVDFWLSDYGVNFSWGFEDGEEFDCGTVKPYFDGCLKKRNGSYVMSFAEIDRVDFNLDMVLQFIWDNVSDGVVIAYNLHI